MIFFIFGTTLLLDFLTKFYISTHFYLGEVLPVYSFFNLVYVENKGISFSLLSFLPSWFFVLLTIGLLFWLWSYVQKTSFLPLKIAYCLIFSGAIGNLYDRITRNGVVDFLDFHFKSYHWPAFNVADICICIGVALILLIHAWQGDFRKLIK